MYDNIGIKKQAIFLLILLLIVVVSVDYQQPPPEKSNSKPEITVEQQEERYADALELAKQGQWESCYNKISIGEIKNPIFHLTPLLKCTMQKERKKGIKKRGWLSKESLIPTNGNLRMD